jgi:hypothetical protein
MSPKMQSAIPPEQDAANSSVAKRQPRTYGRTVIRQSCLAMAALVWLIAGPASYAQSLDPHKPASLGPGVNKGNVDGGTGSHYYYFLAGPGHVNAKMAFKEMGIFGNPRQEVLVSTSTTRAVNSCHTTRWCRLTVWNGSRPEATSAVARKSSLP